MTLQGFAHEADELVAIHPAPRQREYAAVVAELAVPVAVEQCRQQLALAQVAGAAEDHQVEGVGRYELRHQSNLASVIASSITTSGCLRVRAGDCPDGWRHGEVPSWREAGTGVALAGQSTVGNS
jgi:hypothetical protein